VISAEAPDIGGGALDPPRMRASRMLNPALPSEEEREPEHVAEALLTVLEAGDGVLDDLEAVLHDVDEQEREDSHGEHRERDPGAGAKEPEAGEGQPEIDREPGQRAEEDGLTEGQVGISWSFCSRSKSVPAQSRRVGCVF
jgi:hypothetical protein